MGSPFVRKVLIVDDDDVTLEVLSGLLGAQGYQVTTRLQAKGTTTLLMQDPQDVVILDVNMPGLTGDGLLRALEKNAMMGFQMPLIILHSALPAEQIQKIAASNPTLGVIAKGDARSFVQKFEQLIATMQARAKGPPD
jgi:CheY-like chemotaxis protein